MTGIVFKIKSFFAGLFKKSSPKIQPPEPTKEPLPSLDPDTERNLKNQLWYPAAEIVGKKMKTSGKYRKGGPQGAVIHFTAGRCDDEKDALNSVEWLVQQGYVAFVIGPTGKIYQRFPVDEYGAHAGTSSWPGLGSGVSKKLIGIEVCCAGKLDSNLKSWFGQSYAENRVRRVASESNRVGGAYVAFTSAQEKALFSLLKWLYNRDPETFDLELVLGHDEVSPGRKNDPGGSLSLTMPKYRSYLKTHIGVENEHS